MRALRLGVAALSVLLFAVTPALAQDANNEMSSNPVFEKNCAKCHGKTGRGRHMRGPSLVSAKVTENSSADLRAIITEGKKRMPKFEDKLTPDEIDMLVEQIKSSTPKDR